MSVRKGKREVLTWYAKWPFRSRALVIVASLAWPNPARACAEALRLGESILVKHEAALIVWDEECLIEHFVRTAAFDGSASSFGFLVPTPGRPTLAETDESTLLDLYSLTEPEDVYVNKFELDPRLSLISYYFRSDPVSAANPGVDVLEEKHVAGLDATVVSASDAEALSAWLQSHGFEQRADLTRWLAVYVAKGWYVTAFRYERPASNIRGAHGYHDEYITGNVETGESESVLTSKAVRISFPTDEPIYPYLEPSDVPDVPRRVLDLFIVASQRMDGMLVDDGSRPWSAHVVYAASSWFHDGTYSVDRFAHYDFFRKLGVETRTQSWITHYVDNASKRVASDIVFRPAASKSDVYPPPRPKRFPVPVPVPYELLPLGFAGAWWWSRRRARKQRPNTA
jgi:hypothetical protein